MGGRRLPDSSGRQAVEKLYSWEKILTPFVDIHASTSEKLAMGYYLDGKVSVVAGTHTHVPTADYRLLRQGTAYITDVGMCGDYDSVLGFEIDEPINRLARKYSGGRLTGFQRKRDSVRHYCRH